MRLTTVQVEKIILDFAHAAGRSRGAGFDGVQIHCAHGYLVHQFISPAINDRDDIYGIDPVSGIGDRFLRGIVEAVRAECGYDYPVLVKISGDSDWRSGLDKSRFVNLIRALDAMRVDAIEISCGTMEQALNIFRVSSVPWNTIMRYNPRYRVGNKVIEPFWKMFARIAYAPLLKKFTPAYNLHLATIAKQHTTIPVISVGGFRNGMEIAGAIDTNAADLVSMCRPFLCEPDFVIRLKNDPAYTSLCRNCSRCAVMCDTTNQTRCYRGDCHDA